MISFVVALALAPAAGIVPAGAPTPRPTIAGKTPADPDKIVCKSKPMIGSRIKQVKTCMTVAEWNATRADRDQYKRDITSGFGRKVE